MGSQELKAYSDSNYPRSLKKSWMKSIPDSTKLSQMTIPGTHNSCSLHGICIARTQSLTLHDQMEAGLRYFDVRMRLYNNTLRAYHEFIDQKETFDRILFYVTNFLEQNPSESIIMQLVQEYNVKNCDKNMAQLYEDYIKNIKDKIIEYQNQDLTMGDIRGKILFIKIFEGSTRNIPGFMIQNYWSVPWRFSLNRKKRKIKENLHRALAFKNDNKVFLSFLSCASDYALMTPYTAAKKCNEIALRYNGRLGIVLMDYPGEILINHLINQNNSLINQNNNLINENNNLINTNNNLLNNKINLIGEEIVKDGIKEGDLVYIIHNDTQKYLHIDLFNIQNKIYCAKLPFEVKIKHKDKNIDRDYFVENDEICLIGGNNSHYDFKITNIYDAKDDKTICNKSLFKLQIKQGNEMKYLENKYENKNDNSQYIFNITNEPGDYESYFCIKKVLN